MTKQIHLTPVQRRQAIQRHRQAISRLSQGLHPVTPLTSVMEACCAVLGYTPAAIAGPSRKRRLTDARAIVAAELIHAGATLSQAGRALGRHHTTVMSARSTYLALYDTCPEFRAKADACREAVEGIAANQKNEAA